ncbi:MAG: hypothetical protein IPI45_04445 [Saprospiraceae bacterium]|nr:hypothetical protein [Saprospiraceae bacterium]MBK7737012.1 hypothetical protein [Saprospiraceae bacterium]MBK7914394.1 hypothetical protein [Saprospiraceae bacterium]
MPVNSPIDAQKYMQMHKQSLHNRYHDFNTRFNDVINNKKDASDLQSIANSLISIIKACAQNGAKYALKMRKELEDEMSSKVEIRKYKSGELLFPKQQKAN